MSDLPQIADPERQLMLAYAPAAVRPGLGALWALDELLADILRSGREPMVAQLRLTWWHDALCRLDAGPAPAQPVLRALERSVLPAGVSGAMLAGMIDGWEALLDPEPITQAQLDCHATRRGGRLFEAAGALLGATRDPVRQAGMGWALVDLGWHLRADGDASRALAHARPSLDEATAPRWSRAGRPLGMLAWLARGDCRRPIGAVRHQGAPMRLIRMFRHRLSGR
ncbi:MAG: hypothetical protein B7Y45_13240 [Sphingomonas sp. 28-66-16]|nr:MAG: hypothetical protein B7Y45_13240 [Sphingomonas sp. 28-66-16]